MSIEQELKRLRRAVADQVAPAQALQEMKAVRQDDDGFRRRWFRSPERELLAGERDGHWVWLEYSFPVAAHTWVLRWNDGDTPRLWQVEAQAPRNPLNPGSPLLQPLEEALPEAERRQLPQVLAPIPDDLRRLVLLLAGHTA